jgi:pimeloyl-ACP methyl ester carboxylesterase
MRARTVGKVASGTLVMIHGAWQGSWAFDAWRPHCEARGWRTVAVDLPGNGWNPEPLADGLDHCARHVAHVIEEQPGPCVVVGHSGGGLTASQVAELVPDRIAALVYLVGMMLPSGMSFAELVAHARTLHPGADFGGIVPFLERSADGSATSVPVEAALEIFLHDCPPEAARKAAQALRPQPETGRAVAPTVTAERYGRCRGSMSKPCAIVRSTSACNGDAGSGAPERGGSASIAGTSRNSPCPKS